MPDQPIQKTRRKLAALRRRIRAWLLLNGLGLLLVTGTGLVFLSLAIDRLAHMDTAQRTVMLALGLIAIAALAYRRLIRPLTRPVGENGLCLAIEDRHHELRDALITAVQLSSLDDAEARAFSPAMIRRAVLSGTEAADRLDFGEVLDHRRRNRRIAQGSFALLVLLVTCLAAPATMGIWFRRNVLLQSVQWPRETTLRVLGAEDGEITVPDGADLELRVEADPSGVVPAEVRVESRPLDGGSASTESMARLEQNRFRHTFGNVREPFELRVSGNDHTTRWFSVRLLPRPEVEQLRLTVLLPDYVGRQERTLPPGQSAYRVLNGSSLRVEGLARKPLSSAALLRGEKTVAELSPGGQKTFRFDIPGERLRGGRYAIHLTDTSGISTARPAEFVLRIQPDRKPDVRAQLSGIGTLILPGAVLPLEIRLKDDYAITRAWLLAQTGSAEGEDRRQRIDLPGLQPKLGDATGEIRHSSRVETEPLGLQPDSHLLLRVQAKDNDTISGPKLGDSATLSLRVVTPEELREALLRREQELHQTFRRMLRDQVDLRETCRILEADVREDGEVDREKRDSMARLQRGQRKMRQRASDIADQFDLLLARVRNNRLEDPGGPMETRISGEIITPIRSLAAEWLPLAADQFRTARQAENAPTARERLTQAAETQKQIIDRMSRIQKSMLRSETVQEAINMLRRILSKQRRIHEETEQERKESEESVFED